MTIGRFVSASMLVMVAMVVSCKNGGATTCDELFSKFRSAAGVDAEKQKSWFMARCTAADAKVAGCADEVLAGVSGSEKLQKMALAVGIPACIQKHRTSAAGPSAGNQIVAANLQPGLVKLPDKLATLSLDGTA